MSDNVIPIVSGGCLGGAFVLSTAAYCLRNFSRSRLQQVCKDHQKPQRFGEILKRDEDALLACELLLVAIGSVGVAAASLWLLPVEDVENWRAVLRLAGLVLLLLFGVIAIPWSLSLVIGEWFLYRFWPLILGLTTFSRPLLGIFTGINTLFHRVAGREDPAPDTVESFAEEIQSMVDEGQREGVMESRHGEMIQRVMELHEEDVQAVMTPRTDIVFLPVGSTFEEARAVILDSGHSRIPVVGDSADDIVGILYARDLLQHAITDGSLPSNGYHTGAEHHEPEISLRDLARDPLYVPETTTIETLLERMKASRTHVAIVLDEYGGVTGLVTLEDLLEEIVGSIEDEFDDQPEQQIYPVDENTIDVDARVHVDDLNQSYAYSLPEDEDFDTVGGFVFSELGRIPVVGETFRWRDLDFTVLDGDKRRIIKLRIRHDRTAVETVEET
ncbi:MAG: hemolysin family protein [Planctomycetaceae bacterium]